MSSPTPGPGENYPQGGSPQGQPWGTPPPGQGYPAQGYPAQGYPAQDPGAQGYPAQGYPTQGYGAPAPGWNAPAGYGAPGGQRPGQATAAGVIGIVWGSLGALIALLALTVAFDVSALIGLVLLISLALSVGLLVSGIQVVTNKSPKLLLVISYVAIAINVLSLILNLIQDNGAAFNGVLGFVLPALVVTLLRQPQVKLYYASRGMAY